MTALLFFYDGVFNRKAFEPLLLSAKQGMGELRFQLDDIALFGDRRKDSYQEKSGGGQLPEPSMNGTA